MPSFHKSTDKTICSKKCKKWLEAHFITGKSINFAYGEDWWRLGKLKINFVFLLVCTIFVS